MRILLAGSTGSLGRRVRRLLHAAGHEVVGLARGESEGLALDLLDREAVLAAVAGESFDAVVHHATALRRTPLTLRGMEQTNLLRMQGTSTLVAAARATGARRMVSASSFLGYGLFDHGTAPVTESVAFGVPSGSAHDPMLRALESLEQQTAAARGVNLRLGLVYGDRHLAARGRAAEGEALVPLLHVEDAAAATVWALEHGRPGWSYNVADDAPTPLGQFRLAERLAARAAGRAAHASRPAGAPWPPGLVAGTRMVLSTARAKRAGWRPRFRSHGEGLAAGVESDEWHSSI